MQRKNDSQNARGKTEIAIKVLLLIIVIAAALPFFCAIRYTIFIGDDFAFCVSTAAYSGKTWFAKAMQYSWDTYMTWQGTYMTNIANTLFNPLRTYNWTLLRLLLLACAGALLLAVFCLSFEIGKNFGNKNTAANIFALLVLPAILYRDYNEVYLGFISCMAYELPMIFLCVGLALTLRARRTGSRAAAAAAGVFLFLMAGGVLLIGGLGACMMLLLLVTDWIDKGKINKTYGVLFAVTVISDLINTLAPGNFVKHSQVGELQLLNSVIASVKTVTYEFSFLMGHFSFIAFILLAFLLGWSIGKKQKPLGFAASVVILAVTPVIVMFPMMLGYSGNGIADVPDRGLFVLDIALILSVEIISALAGNQLGTAITEKAGESGRIMITAAAGILLFVSLLSLKDCIPVKITENLMSGKIQKYGTVWRMYYDEMRDRPGEDIVIIDLPETCEGTMDDPIVAHGNIYLEKYFGNNSICTGYHVAMMNGTLQEE